MNKFTKLAATVVVLDLAVCLWRTTRVAKEFLAKRKHKNAVYQKWLQSVLGRPI